MPSFNRSTDFYKALCPAIMYTPDENGVLSLEIGDQKVPAVINDRQLVIPYPQYLTGQTSWEHYIAFHPLSESMLRGESEVFTRIRMNMMTKLNTSVIVVIRMLMLLASDKERQKTMDPGLKDLLTAVPKVNAKVVTTVGNILDRTSVLTANRIVSLYLKRGGKIGNTAYTRTCMVSFPIMSELVDGADRVFDVAVDKRSTESLRGLLKYIFKKADEPDAYSRGTNQLEVPNLHAILLAYRDLAIELNSVLERFKAYIPEHDRWMVSMDWVPFIDEIQSFRLEIPALDGNVGKDVEEKKEPGFGSGHAAPVTTTAQPPATAAPAATAAPVTAGVFATGSPAPASQAPAQQAVQSAPSEPAKAGGSNPFNVESFKTLTVPIANNPAAVAALVPGAVGLPVAAPVAAPAVAPVNNGNGVPFEAMLASNPAMAAAYYAAMNANNPPWLAPVGPQAATPGRAALATTQPMWGAPQPQPVWGGAVGWGGQPQQPVWGAAPAPQPMWGAQTNAFGTGV